jgi:hypothetical protein
MSKHACASGVCDQVAWVCLMNCDVARNLTKRSQDSGRLALGHDVVSCHVACIEHREVDRPIYKYPEDKNAGLISKSRKRQET